MSSRSVQTGGQALIPSCPSYALRLPLREGLHHSRSRPTRPQLTRVLSRRHPSTMMLGLQPTMLLFHRQVSLFGRLQPPHHSLTQDQTFTPTQPPHRSHPHHQTATQSTTQIRTALCLTIPGRQASAQTRHCHTQACSVLVLPTIAVAAANAAAGWSSPVQCNHTCPAAVTLAPLPLWRNDCAMAGRIPTVAHSGHCRSGEAAHQVSSVRLHIASIV